MPIADRMAKASTAIVVVLALALLGSGSVVAQNPPFELVARDTCPIGDMVAVGECLHIRDRRDDLLTADGQMLFDSDPSVDVAEVWFATTTLTGKNRKAIDKRMKRAGEHVGAGAQAKLKKGQPVAIAMYKLFEPVQCDGQGNFQSWFAYDGSDPTRLGVGAWANLQAGTETLVIGGRFGTGDDTSYASITTDLSGVGPGEPLQWGNAKARDFVWCEEAQGVVVHVSRIPNGAASVGLGLISDHGDTVAQDRVGVPTDTVRILLSMDEVLPGYSCSSIVHRQASGDDSAEGSRLVATVVAPLTSADRAQRQDELDALNEILGDLFYIDGKSTETIEAEAFAVGDVGWSQVILDAEGVSIHPTPSTSEARRSTGLEIQAQLADVGIDVTLLGDPLCGFFELTTNVCDLADADAFATTLGVPQEGVTKRAVVSSDADGLCLLTGLGQSSPFGVLIVETEPHRIDEHHTDPPPPTCERDPSLAGREDAYFVCADDIKSVLRQVDPETLTQGSGQDWLEFDRRIQVTIDVLPDGGAGFEPLAEDISELFDGVAQNLSESVHIHEGSLLEDAGWILEDAGWIIHDEECTGC